MPYFSLRQNVTIKGNPIEDERQKVLHKTSNMY